MGQHLANRHVQGCKCCLTLPSSEQPTAGFVVCRLPLRPNVGTHGGPDEHHSRHPPQLRASPRRRQDRGIAGIRCILGGTGERLIPAPRSRQALVGLRLLRVLVYVGEASSRRGARSSALWYCNCRTGGIRFRALSSIEISRRVRPSANRRLAYRSNYGASHYAVPNARRWHGTSAGGRLTIHSSRPRFVGRLNSGVGLAGHVRTNHEASSHFRRDPEREHSRCIG